MKPGYKTTEFYGSVAASVGSLAASIAGGLPPKYAAIVTSVSVGAYTLSRGIAKFNTVAETAGGDGTVVSDATVLEKLVAKFVMQQLAALEQANTTASPPAA